MIIGTLKKVAVVGVMAAMITSGCGFARLPVARLENYMPLRVRIAAIRARSSYNCTRDGIANSVSSARSKVTRFKGKVKHARKSASRNLNGLTK